MFQTYRITVYNTTITKYSFEQSSSKFKKANSQAGTKNKKETPRQHGEQILKTKSIGTSKPDTCPQTWGFNANAKVESEASEISLALLSSDFGLCGGKVTC